jgi:hypothetical protein
MLDGHMAVMGRKDVTDEWPSKAKFSGCAAYESYAVSW